MQQLTPKEEAIQLVEKFSKIVAGPAIKKGAIICVDNEIQHLTDLFNLWRSNSISDIPIFLENTIAILDEVKKEISKL